MAPTPRQDAAETRRGDSARDDLAALRASKDTGEHRGTSLLASATGIGETRKPMCVSGDGDAPSGSTRVDDEGELAPDATDPGRTKSRVFVRDSSEELSETSLLSNSSRHAEEPEDLTCPVTKIMFRDPVFVAGSGNTYERAAIETFWRARRDRRDPLTNAHVKNATLFTNWTKRREVDAWLTRHPNQTPEGWASRSVPPPLEARDARRRRGRNRDDGSAERDDAASDEDDEQHARRRGRFFLPTTFAVAATAALFATAFLAATAPAPPPGFPQFPPGVVASTLKGSGVTGMPAPPAWYAAMRAVKPPSGSRVRARRGSRGALEIVIPPRGDAARGDALAELGFAAAWSAFTGAWTLGACRGPTPAVALFSAPFWGVSAHLGKAALCAATETTRVVFFPPSDSETFESAGDVPFVDETALDGTFRVSWEIFGRQVGCASGSLLELDGAEIVTRAYVNGVPQTGIELREGVKSHAVGRGMHPAEQSFVSELVADALAEAKKAREIASHSKDKDVISNGPDSDRGDDRTVPGDRADASKTVGRLVAANEAGEDAGRARTRARL